MNTSQLLSAYEIAKSINRSHPSVLETIRKLGIKPSFKIGNRKYYDSSTIDKINSSMRNPNKK